MTLEITISGRDRVDALLNLRRLLEDETAILVNNSNTMGLMDGYNFDFKWSPEKLQKRKTK